MPAPLADGIDYREAYGLLLFDCQPLRATLSPESCAAQWNKNAEGSACRGCKVGAVHAGHAPTDALIASRKKTCVRCGTCEYRLLAESLCIGCYNRAREAAVRRNGKGGPPRLWLSRLKQAHAIVALPPGAKIPAKHRGHGLPVLPTWERLDPGHAWLEFIAIDRDEIKRLVCQTTPGATIVAVEFVPPPHHRRPGSLFPANQRRPPIHRQPAKSGLSLAGQSAAPPADRDRILCFSSRKPTK